MSVGRLTKQKDFYNLIIAFNLIKHKIPTYKLIIVGDGQLKGELKKLTNYLGLKKRVIFTGWVENLKKYYLNSKLFVLNSLYEGFGNVLIDSIKATNSCDMLVWPPSDATKNRSPSVPCRIIFS